MISRLDHLVLTVSDIDATIDFYTTQLGMRLETFGDGRKALHFGEQKINLHVVGSEFDPKARAPTAGAADLCFVVEVDVEVLAAQLQTAGVAIDEGPIDKVGALGPIRSIYLRDPDGNLIELSNYRSAE